VSRGARGLLAVAAALVLAGLAVLACTGLAPLGATRHPYRDRAVDAAVRHVTANVVSSVNFDQRGLDTLGEETILLAATAGATVLLRPSEEERRAGRRRRDVRPSAHPPPGVLAVTRFTGLVLLPVSLVLGADVVAHGAITPGGGFQGGVVLATAVHLMFVSGDYPALQRMRPVSLGEWLDPVGAAGYLLIGVAGLAAGGAYLADVLPGGTFTDLLSAGTVPLLSAAVGVEVAGGVVVLLGRFLEQTFEIGEA